LHGPRNCNFLRFIFKREILRSYDYFVKFTKFGFLNKQSLQQNTILSKGTGISRTRLNYYLFSLWKNTKSDNISWVISWKIFNQDFHHCFIRIIDPRWKFKNLYGNHILERCHNLIKLQFKNWTWTINKIVEIESTKI
jgi:hypothetical protein